MAIPQRYALLTEMRLEQALANYLRDILLKSAKGISKDITALGKDGEPLTQMQLNAQRKAIQAVLEQDFSNLETAIAQGKIEAAKAASGVVSRYENQLLAAVMAPDAVRRIAKGEVQRTVAGLEAALQRIKGRSYKPLSSQVYDTRKLANGWVSDKINQALVSGWDARRLANEIRQSISPDVPGGVSYAANRLARTEINNAFHAASADRYMNSPIVESVDWHLSTSHPEGDICDVFADESPYPKDAVPEKPHPNCYCYITPHLPSQEEFLDNLLAGKYDEEAFGGEDNKFADPLDVKTINLPDDGRTGYGSSSFIMESGVDGGDWRFITDRDQRATVMLQNDYRSERAIKSVARNLRDGKDPFDGAEIDEYFLKNFTGMPSSIKYTDHADNLAFEFSERDVRNAIEDSARWLLSQKGESADLLYKGLDVYSDQMDAFVVGKEFRVDFSSFSKNQKVADLYAGRSDKVIVRVKNAGGIPLQDKNNPSQFASGSTKHEEYLLSGNGRIVAVETKDGVTWVDVEF